MKFSGKLNGVRKTLKDFESIEPKIKQKIEKDVKAAADEIARVARILVPVASGQLKGWINVKTHFVKNARYAFVNFAPNNPADIIKALVVEYGRKGARVGSGSRVRSGGARVAASTGSTEGAGYQRKATQYGATKYRRRISRSINKAVKEAMNG